MAGASVADVLVIGAGISGLACAHALGTRRDVRVLEAGPRAGGLVRTLAHDGYRWEEGPEALPPSARGVRALCGQLGLELDEAPAAAARRYVLHRGALLAVPLAPPALLGTKLFSWRGKLRLLSEPWRARGLALDGSIAAFIEHRLGRECLERLVDPLVGGIHAGIPAQLSLGAAFPELAELVRRHGSLFAALRARASGASDAPRALWKPRAGLQALTDALAGALGPRLELGRRVRALTRTDTGYRVELEDGASHAARQVVLALPLAGARALLASAAPEVARALAPMEAESLVSVVHAWRRADVAHPLDGFGYLLPSSHGSPVLGTLFSSSLWPRTAPAERVLLRTLLGGARHARLHERDDAALEATVVAEARASLGAREAPLFVRVARYPAVIPRFDLAHPERQRALAVGLPAQLHVLGNFTRGIGLARLVDEAQALAARL